MSPALAVYRLFDLIMLLMLIRVFLTWIPNINWYSQPFRFLKVSTDLFFEPFKRIIPPIGMIDISPIFAFLVLGIIQRALYFALVKMGL